MPKKIDLLFFLDQAYCKATSLYMSTPRLGDTIPLFLFDFNPEGQDLLIVLDLAPAAEDKGDDEKNQEKEVIREDTKVKVDVAIATDKGIPTF